jgi:hypothetical protein
MSWFKFLSTLNNSGEVVTQSAVEKYPPVRRKINFPIIQENLKIGDWIYVNLQDLEVGKVYSYNEGIVSSVADEDSYLVVYENNDLYQPTYSYIDENNNLFFKSLTDIPAGSFDPGNYYIYYHYNNIQRLTLVDDEYLQAEISIAGFKAFDDGSGTEESNINKYSNVVIGSTLNERVASLSYISSSGLWVDQQSDSPGNKVVGTFDGPYLKIYGKKSPDSGKISIKIIKTSTTGLGQSIIKTDIVDMYNSSINEEVEIYSLDIINQTSIVETEEIYGSFMFEIEILDDKNISSSGKNIKIIKYAFAKNYSLYADDEEIYEGITFSSTGVIR